MKKWLKFLSLIVFSIISISLAGATSECGNNANDGSFSDRQEIINAGACASGTLLYHNEINPNFDKFKWEWKCVKSNAQLDDCSANYVLKGQGIPLDPYQINDCLDLEVINNHLNSHYILLNDIDCSSMVYNSDDPPFTAIGKTGNNKYSSFTGNFNGNNKIIKNLVIIQLGSYVGLFAHIGSGGVVNNLGLVDIYLRASPETSYPSTSYNYVGGIAGGNKGTINNSFVKRIGAFGRGDASWISWIRFPNNIDGLDYVGGLVGVNEGTIKDSYSRDLNIRGNNFVGGIAGSNSEPGKITNSYSTSNFSIEGGYAGGLVGMNGYGTSAIVGGGGIIQNSFSTGKIECNSFSCPYVRISVGENKEGTLSNIYCYNDESDSAIKSIDCTLQLLNYFKGAVKNNEPFKQWDFINNWLEVANDFPKLKWEETCVKENGGVCGLSPCSNDKINLGQLDCGTSYSCCKTKIVIPTTGVCGSATLKEHDLKPTANLCVVARTETTIIGHGTTTEPWTWTCPGTSTSATCKAYGKGQMPVNTTNCGKTVQEKILSSAPATNLLCISGTATNFKTNANIGWTWDCGTSSCWATKKTTDTYTCSYNCKDACSSTEEQTSETCENNKKCCKIKPTPGEKEGVCGKDVVDNSPFLYIEDLDDFIKDNPLCDKGTAQPKESDEKDYSLAKNSKSGVEYIAEWYCGTTPCSVDIINPIPGPNIQYSIEQDCDNYDYMVVKYGETTRKVYCPAPLPFFTLTNIVAVLVVVGVFYVIMQRGRKGKRKR